MKRHIYVDLETTGLEPSKGAVILSIGAIGEVGHNKADPGLQEFYGVVCPTEQQWRNAAPEALKLNGFTLEQLKAEGRPFADVRDDFIRWLYVNRIIDRTHQYVGQSPQFDLKFLNYFMGAELAAFDFPLSPPLDVRDLYSILVNRKLAPRLEYRSGENIAKALGVPPEPAVHNALEGAKVVRRNYQKILEFGIRK
jgi:DNA polymerase III epsilon subunit-like protein